MPTDSTTESVPNRSRRDVPPLRIHHILVATAVTAGLLTVTKTLIDSDMLGLASFLTSGSGILHTVSTGVAITAVGYGIAWRRAGHMFFHQPGHWLLLFDVFSVVFYLIFGIGYLLQLTVGDDFQSVMNGIYAIVLFVGWITIHGLAAWKADSRWWRWYFIIQGLMIFAVLVFARTGVLGQEIYCAGLLALMAAAILGDRRAGRQRDWPHWLGVILVSAELAVTAFPA